MSLVVTLLKCFNPGHRDTLAMLMVYEYIMSSRSESQDLLDRDVSLETVIGKDILNERPDVVPKDSAVI